VEYFSITKCHQIKTIYIYFKNEIYLEFYKTNQRTFYDLKALGIKLIISVLLPFHFLSSVGTDIINLIPRAFILRFESSWY